MKTIDLSWRERLWIGIITFASLILKIYTSQFTSIHGFNEITRFIDYHVSDVFSVVMFSFMGLNVLYSHPKGQIKNVGYYIGIIVTILAFFTEFIDSWKCGKLTNTGDNIDMIMYLVGLMIFCTIYYIFEKRTNQSKGS